MKFCLNLTFYLLTLSVVLVAQEVDEVGLKQNTIELQTPELEEGPPQPGKRVKVVSPEYIGTEVYYSLYLPRDWTAGGSYPVIVEYTGNEFAPTGSTGEVDHANLGYGLSGGEGAIWVVLPCISEDHKRNEKKWWGDREATVEYCQRNVVRICQQYGGDPERLLLCGFSRGAIAASYIGLANDEVASLWKGIFTHDHFDGEKTWSYQESDRESALMRLNRLEGRPVLVSSQSSRIRDYYLNDHLELADFQFLVVPVKQIFTIPEGGVVHSHTDMWMHKPSQYREIVRKWFKEHFSK